MASQVATPVDPRARLRKRIERFCRRLRNEVSPFRFRLLAGKLFYRLFTEPKSATELYCRLCSSTFSLGSIPLTITQVYLACYKHLVQQHPDLLLLIIRGETDQLLKFASQQ